jgi:NAD(P)-dependent dehydrogenase (short-subunit alcohol dehydrogenase family)
MQDVRSHVAPSAERSLEDRVALVTGGAQGLGAATCRVLAGAGATVIPADVHGDAAAALADELRDDGANAHAVELDVRDERSARAAVEEALGRFGRIDVLVNNAGRTQVGAVEETTDEELRALFDLHFFAPTALTRAVLPHMRRQGGGAIVQMSSVGGQVTAPGFGAYCATKFALEGLTETLRDEVAGFGIRTLIVEPGAFRTGLFRADAAYESAEMSEYTETVGPTREYVRTNHGAQPGDPAKAADAIIAALDADEPPLRLVLGADAIDNIESHLNGVGEELERWRSLGEATAVDDV